MAHNLGFCTVKARCRIIYFRAGPGVNWLEEERYANFRQPGTRSVPGLRKFQISACNGRADFLKCRIEGLEDISDQDPD